MNNLLTISFEAHHAGKNHHRRGPARLGELVLLDQRRQGDESFADESAIRRV